MRQWRVKPPRRAPRTQHSLHNKLHNFAGGGTDGGTDGAFQRNHTFIKNRTPVEARKLVQAPVFLCGGIERENLASSISETARFIEIIGTRYFSGSFISSDCSAAFALVVRCSLSFDTKEQGTHVAATNLTRVAWFSLRQCESEQAGDQRVHGLRTTGPWSQRQS